MENWVIGVDLGGTKVELGIVDPQGQIVARRRIATLPQQGPQSLVERIAAEVDALRQITPPAARLAALGLCSPGPVDHLTGTLLDPPNMPGLHHTPLAALLRERLGAPVRIDHDAKATGLGEYHYGAGRGERSMVYVIVGTGVGIAIIADGQIYRGLHNSAGEFGHTTMDRTGAVCSCGSRGCVETFMSGPWLARRYAAAQRGETPTLETVTTLGGQEIAALAQQGDPLALRVITEAGEALGAADCHTGDDARHRVLRDRRVGGALRRTAFCAGAAHRAALLVQVGWRTRARSWAINSTPTARCWAVRGWRGRHWKIKARKWRVSNEFQTTSHTCISLRACSPK
jgi:glucokinase